MTEHDGGAWCSWLAARGCESWSDWLQSYRIELNAMPPADRIAWVTGKVEKHPPRKVIPPAPLLHAKRITAASAAIADELQKRARIEERTTEILQQIEWPSQARALEITCRYLERHRRDHWPDPMEAAGKQLAKRTMAKLDAEGTTP